MCSLAEIKVSLWCKVLIWSKLERPVPCPRLHLAVSQRAWSPFHRSIKATDSVRGDGGQTEVRQTIHLGGERLICASVATWLPATGTHLFIFVPWKFHEPRVYSTCNGPAVTKHSIAITSTALPFHFFLFPLFHSVEEISCWNIY